MLYWGTVPKVGTSAKESYGHEDSNHLHDLLLAGSALCGGAACFLTLSVPPTHAVSLQEVHRVPCNSAARVEMH